MLLASPVRQVAPRPGVLEASPGHLCLAVWGLARPLVNTLYGCRRIPLVTIRTARDRYRTLAGFGGLSGLGEYEPVRAVFGSRQKPFVLPNPLAPPHPDQAPVAVSGSTNGYKRGPKTKISHPGRFRLSFRTPGLPPVNGYPSRTCHPSKGGASHLWNPVRMQGVRRPTNTRPTEVLYRAVAG